MEVANERAAQGRTKDAVATASSVSMEDLQQLGERVTNLNERIKQVIFRPEGMKAPPVFNAAQVAELCGQSYEKFKRLLQRAGERGLPTGAGKKAVSEEGAAASRNRMFTLEDARAWVRAEGSMHHRAEGQQGAVITVGNFKGGVGKTVLSMSLAQGLSLRGYKVLCIDYDPQGSLTSLFGLTPTDFDAEETVMPLMLPRDREGARSTLQESIKASYWDGIDLVPGNSSLFAGEFFLPIRQQAALMKNSAEPNFLFLEVLENALRLGPRDEYDFIIIDTPPALSYLTMTTYWAADALLVPLPPEGLDFTSSGQFFSMMAELAGTDRGLASKVYSWIGVVPSKVDNTKLHTKEILKWMQDGFGRHLLNLEIPETAAVRVGGMSLNTVYDISKYVGSRKTLLRARDAYDKAVDLVEHMTRSTLWRNANPA